MEEEECSEEVYADRVRWAAEGIARDKRGNPFRYFHVDEYDI